MSPGHSGSTLLDLVLGSHSQVFGLGELKTIFDEYQSHKGMKICGVCKQECEFWDSTDVSAEINSILHRKKIKELYLSQFSNNNVYKILSSSFNVPIRLRFIFGVSILYAGNRQN